MLLLGLAVTLLCLAVTPTSAKHSSELSVKLTDGSPVYGKYLTSHGGHGIRAFTNIPYAEAPVDQLRFADPVPKVPWAEGEFTQPEEVIYCPQEEVFFNEGRYVGQEDCLFLNVYVPMFPKTKDRLPVMFYIHGGGYATGNGGETIYGPEFLLEEDVILVAGNYRLSALGFLSTFTEEFPGNYGMKDQVLMLKWIQQNIAEFGGDPWRVTIFGESAGAGSVGYHLLSPMSKGLFQGAILQSGSPYENWSNISQAQSLLFAEKLMTEMGCEFSTGDYKNALDCLRGKDEKEFVAKLKSLMVWGHNPLVMFSPVKEINSKSPFITQLDYASAQIGNNIPVMIGVVANEGAFFSAMIEASAEIRPELEQNFDELLSSLSFIYDRFDKETMRQNVVLMKQRYFNGENFSWPAHNRGIIELMTENCFLPGLSLMLKKRLTAQEGTFVYKFNYRGSSSFTDLAMKKAKEERNFGVSHIDDLLYLFPIVKNVMRTRVMSEEDHKMRKQMVKMWVNFATNGNPSTKHANWTPIKQFPIDYMRIGNCNLDVCAVNTKTVSAMETGFLEENFKFIENMYYGPNTGAVGKEEL